MDEPVKRGMAIIRRYFHEHLMGGDTSVFDLDTADLVTAANEIALALDAACIERGIGTLPFNDIQAMKMDLADNRIKHGCDYAMIHKYDETHVLCNEIWVESIKEAAERHRVTIHHWHTYLTDRWKENNEKAAKN